ncbi:MAG: thiamine pyrophosphate-binding protein, partial [Phycisphaerales bacterium JB063]
MTGAQIFNAMMAEHEVECMFGYPGGAILPVFDAIHESGQFDFILSRHEQGASHMAEGYARVTGKPGIVLVTSGPGATNTVTPVRDCMADSIPMVVICGQVPTGAVGTDAFQEAPISSIMGAAAKHVFLVTDPKKLEATVRTAFEIARTGRPGPVVVDIPKDVQNWSGPFDG